MQRPPLTCACLQGQSSLPNVCGQLPEHAIDLRREMLGHLRVSDAAEVLVVVLVALVRERVPPEAGARAISLRCGDHSCADWRLSRSMASAIRGLSISWTATSRENWAASRNPTMTASRSLGAPFS